MYASTPKVVSGAGDVSSKHDPELSGDVMTASKISADIVISYHGVYSILWVTVGYVSLFFEPVQSATRWIPVISAFGISVSRLLFYVHFLLDDGMVLYYVLLCSSLLVKQVI
ncbi:hypothetical protein NP493_48g02036 [Ridgeia piscesae]|uniref:Uncharacterized protein n=1 Tax=Ridgeia piscesae TaxID=27915 RepID=A0AAD9UJC5_RIDPI|nr:hypothetical protein NP493_48g02036 [Ridgeia piscesae]